MTGAVPQLRQGISLATFTTLKAGGSADWFCEVRNVDDLALIAQAAHTTGRRLTILGWGSNVLPADEGVEGTVVVNTTGRMTVGANGAIEADAACNFQEVFLKSAQAGLSGLEFAVGIPGTLGGALVSNAGAYRSNVSALLEAIEVVQDGQRAWVSPEVMKFSYRDSVLRQLHPPKLVLLRVRLRLTPGDPKAIYDAARDFQRQRISKQPAPASAGSFFKNVTDEHLAQTIPGLSDGMRENKVVPAGFLLQAAGMSGTRLGGAMLSQRHANFMLNVGRATATEIRSLAKLAKGRVKDRFGVELEEEVLYLGRWPD